MPAASPGVQRLPIEPGVETAAQYPEEVGVVVAPLASANPETRVQDRDCGGWRRQPVCRPSGLSDAEQRHPRCDPAKGGETLPSARARPGWSRSATTSNAAEDGLLVGVQLSIGREDGADEQSHGQEGGVADFSGLSTNGLATEMGARLEFTRPCPGSGGEP